MKLIKKCLVNKIMSRFAMIPAGGHLFRTYAKFSEKLTFLTPLYAHARVKSSIPTWRDPSFVLPVSRFAVTKFFHVLASTCLSEMKNKI